MPIEVMDGQVTAERIDGGWIHVSIGRARYVKRFNLSHAEASQLLDLLSEIMNPALSE